MNAKRKPKIYERILSKINFNTIFMAVITGYFGLMGLRYENKQDLSSAKIDKIDSTNIRSAIWKLRSDSLHLVLRNKIDSVLIILKKKR